MDFTQFKNVNSLLSVQDRIAFLKYCANKYEGGVSPISDAEYDKEYYALELICPNDPFFDTVGGIDEHLYGTLVKHDITMGSLLKCPTVAEFKQWILSTFNQNSIPSFVLQHKIDGLSLSLLYKDGKLVRALTRGDGSEGVDVTPNAIHVSGIPSTIADCSEVEIRGEVYKNRQDFYKNWHLSVGGEYKNPRNFSSGSLNQKESLVTKSRGLDFISYQVCRKEFAYETDKLSYLKSQGFNVVDVTVLPQGVNIEALVQIVEQYMNAIDRVALPYDIDGVCVKMNNVKEAEKMGTVSNGRKPKSARAVKFKSEAVQTKFIGVEVNVGRTGKVAPVAILEPVELGGATIQRATLHNFGMLIGKDALKIGSIVEIQKRGDIIPQIVRTITQGDTSINIPTNCPSCGSTLIWTCNASNEKVDLVCENSSCVAQISTMIEHFLKVLGVKGIGIGIINKLTDKNELSKNGKDEALVSSISDLYSLVYDSAKMSRVPFYVSEDKLIQYFGKKAWENIIDSITAIQEVTLNILIEALGIAKIGSMSKDLTDIAPTIEDIDKLTVEDIVKISGFGPIKSNNFVNEWKTNRNEIEKILQYIKIKPMVKASSKLDGKKFCFTGSFSRPRTELEKIVVENGGKCASVGKDLTALFSDGEISGSKIQKAQKLGIPILSEEDFWKMIGIVG